MDSTSPHTLQMSPPTFKSRKIIDPRACWTPAPDPEYYSMHYLPYQSNPRSGFPPFPQPATQGAPAPSRRYGGTAPEHTPSVERSPAYPPVQPQTFYRVSAVNDYSDRYEGSSQVDNYRRSDTMSVRPGRGNNDREGRVYSRGAGLSQSRHSGGRSSTSDTWEKGMDLQPYQARPPFNGVSSDPASSTRISSSGVLEGLRKHYDLTLLLTGDSRGLYRAMTGVRTLTKLKRVPVGQVPTIQSVPFAQIWSDLARKDINRHKPKILGPS